MLVDERGPAVNDDPQVIEKDPEVVVTPRATKAKRRARRQPRELPTWFVAGLAALVVWFATVGAIGTVLLAFDWYKPALVMLPATAAAVAVVVTVVRRLGKRPRAAHVTALAAVGIAIGFLVFAGMYQSEHVLTDRDPAVYINNGRSIARNQELHPVVRTGPYTDGLYSMRAASFGDNAQGRLQPDFFPMLPAILAAGWSIGGDNGLLLTPAVLGAIGVLAVFALTARVIAARAALLAVAFFVVAPLQLWFARDAYSELIVQVVTLGGLWLYLEARARLSPSLAAVAGGVIASSAFARIDTMLIVVGTVLFIALDWTRADDDADPKRSRTTVGAFATGLGAVLITALFITRYEARSYVNALADEYRQAVIAAVASVVVAVAIVVVHRLRPGIWRRIGGNRIVFAVIGVVAAAAFAYAYWIRPEADHLLPQIIPGRALAPDVRQAINEWHWSYSLHWLTSYYGFVGIAFATAGLVLLLGLGLRGNRAASAVSFVIIPVTALYIARPSISPDQPWAMRRYLPVVLPGLAIAIASGLAWLWWQRTRFRSVAARVVLSIVTVALGIATIVPSAIAAPPFLTASMHDGAHAAIDGICDEVGSDGAVFVFGGGFIDVLLPQTVRGFCGVPAATIRDPRALDLPGLSAQWQRAGRKLFVATAQPEGLIETTPTAIPVARWHIGDANDPERVLDRRPERSQAPRTYDIWLYAIPPGEI
jgi:hypothetical protein